MDTVRHFLALIVLVVSALVYTKFLSPGNDEVDANRAPEPAAVETQR